jgi:hypothetical protein
VLQLTDRVIRNPGTVSEPTPGGHLVLDLATGAYYDVGPVGSFIWERLDGISELGVLADQLVASFEVALPQAQSCLVEFATQLVEAGLASVTVEPLP